MIRNKNMSKIYNLLKSPHIHLAIATGISIIVMAYFSKHILPKPISFLQLSIPPFWVVIYEVVLGKYSESKLSNSIYWVIAILLSTAIIIIINL